MTRRGIIGLVVALLALAGLVAIGQRSRAPVSTAGGPLVPGLEAALNDLERVTLVKGGGETVATLERRADSWVVAEKNGYPADTSKLRQNLRALGEAKILETKTANPALHGKLGVADVAAADATGIAITLAAPGKNLPTVIIGDEQGNKYRYARRATDAQSYLIDRSPSFPHAAAQWLDPVILNVAGSRVQQITIKQPDGETLTLRKAEPGAQNFDVGTPLPKGGELLYAGVANVVGNALRELNLQDVEQAQGTALEMPIEVEFRTFDGLVIHASGAKRNDQAWVAFSASFDPAQAARFKKPETAPDATTPPAAAAAAPAADAPTPAAEDPATEATRINARVSGWRYKLAGFQFAQMTRRLSDLLKPPAAPAVKPPAGPTVKPPAGPVSR